MHETDLIHSVLDGTSASGELHRAYETYSDSYFRLVPVTVEDSG